MSEPSTITPRKGPRPKNQNRSKPADGILPSTPATKPIHVHDGFYSETQGSDSQTPTRRTRKTPNIHKTTHPSIASIPVKSGDGTSYASTSPHKTQTFSNNSNHSKTMTPIKQAYAGPTFHASPAPSSLPIPKFFSKSVPAEASHAIAQIQLGTSPATQSISPSPGPEYFSPDPQVPVQREASPLDLLFNAHRAEKARQKTGDLLQGVSPSAQQFRSETIHGPLKRTDLNHSQMSQQVQPQNSQRLSGKEMFMMELDGTGDRELAGKGNNCNPTPFRERIHATRSNSSPAYAPTKATLDEQDRLAKTLALKQLLKGMPTMSEQTSLYQPQSSDRQQHMSNFHGFGTNPSDFAPSQSHQPLIASQDDSPQSRDPTGHKDVTFTPTKPAQDSARSSARRVPSNAPDVKSMEADLRRILKLDPRT